MLRLKKCSFGYIIPVEVCNQVLFFLLDSGAQKTMIQATVAEKLHLPVHTANFCVNNARNNRQLLDKKCCAELLVDSFSAGIVEMVVYDYSQFPMRNIHGILGADIIYKFCFMLSIANGTFIILRSAAIRNELFVVETEPDRQINAILDTAASSSWITNDSALVNKLDIRKRFSLFLSFGGISINRNMECKLIKIKVGGHPLQCKRVNIGRSVKRNDKKIELILGLDIIRKFHVCYTDGDFIFQPAGIERIEKTGCV